MKKMVIIGLAIMFAVTVSSSAFAAATTVAYAESPTVGSLGVVNTSTNVLMAYKSSADNSGYTVGTYHNKGTKTFGSSSGDTAIFDAAATGQAIPAAPVGTASAAFTSGTWDAL